MTEDTLELTYDIYIAAAPTRVWDGLIDDGFRGQTATYASSAGAWPQMMSSLKSLIETGHSLNMGTE